MDCLSLGARRRGFTPRASVSSSITHRGCPCVCISLPLNLFHLISAVDVILIGLDYLSILYLAYVYIPHINCLTLSLNWYFVNWGSNRSRVFCTHIELSIGIKAGSLILVSLP